MSNKQSYIDEYKVLRGGQLLIIPLNDLEFKTAWNIAVRNVREHTYIGSVAPMTLSSRMSLPDDGDDILDIVPISTDFNIVDDGIDVTVDLTTDQLEGLLRAIYLNEDIRSMSSWVIDFNFNRVTNEVEVYNFAGHEGENCLVYYQLKEEFFNPRFLSQKGRNWFISFFNAILDTILGSKLRRHPENTDGESLVSEGKADIIDLKETAMGIFIEPVLLIS
jgi:hypothetical protein